MRGFRTILVVAAVWVLTLAGSASAATTWHVVKSPNPGSNGPYVARGFTEVTAASAKRVWAAGFSHGPMIARWNGTAWHLDSLPKEKNVYWVRAVDTNGTAVWAAGGDPDEPIALYMKAGAWEFRRITNAPSGATVRDLSVLSNSNVWAVGNDSSGVAALAMHWNGSKWKSKPPPFPSGAGGVQLNTVENIRGTNKVMADGYYVKNFQFYPYAAEWNGSTWHVQTTPTSPYGEFWGLVVRSSSNAWAVGDANPSSSSPKTLIDHWNGTQWTRVTSPSRTGGQYLLSVDARSNGDIWAAGSSYTCGQVCSHHRTLALHYNGFKWSIGTSANPSTNGVDEFWGTSYVPGTNQFWAVGTEGPSRPANSGEFTLTERCIC